MKVRDTLTDSREVRCQACLLQLRGCVCAALTKVSDNVTHISIIRHILETKKVSNTGRFAATALANSTLHTFGDQFAPLDGSLLRQPDTWLLFPEGAPTTSMPTPPPKNLIILDGTWHQARRMRQRIQALRGLPIVSLPAPAQPRTRMRRPPSQEAMSTLEAIAAALRLLGEARVADELDVVHEAVVAAAQLPGRRRLNAV